MILKPADRRSWLEARRRGIGGSDAGAVIGVNRYRSNIDVWSEKAGITPHEDISDKPAVKFGKEAEQHLRELYKLEHPEQSVEYHEFYMYVNDSEPYLYATLDGEITDGNGRHGILEIKTATIQNAAQWNEWTDPKTKAERIPDSYYAQCLHQLAATGWDFVTLFAYIRTGYQNARYTAHVLTRHIEREDVQEEIEYLIDREQSFWDCVQRKERPTLILPKI